jgi:hypothetical protein
MTRRDRTRGGSKSSASDQSSDREPVTEAPVRSHAAEDQLDRRDRVIERQVDQDQPKGKGIVAPGRTVEAAIPGSRRFVGYSSDGSGTAIYGPEYTHYGPGQEVEIPLRDLERLKELGFIVDPKRRLDLPAQGRPATERQATATRARQNGAHVSA